MMPFRHGNQQTRRTYHDSRT